MSTTKSTTTKPEKTTDRIPVILKCLPLWVFALIAGFIVSAIYFKSGFRADIFSNGESISIDSTRRFYAFSEELVKAGYLRCDDYLGSPDCPDRAALEKMKNVFYEIRHKTKKGDDKLLPETFDKPHHILKTLVINPDSAEEKYIGVILYSAQKNLMLAPELLKLVTNKQCKNTFARWYFIEDPLVLSYLENFYHVRFLDKSLPLQIIEKSGNKYLDSSVRAKNIIQNFNKPLATTDCFAF